MRGIEKASVCVVERTQDPIGVVGAPGVEVQGRRGPFVPHHALHRVRWAPSSTSHVQVQAIAHAAAELEELGLVRRVNLDVRLHALPPLFKLFIVNDADAFFGFYPIQRRTIPIQGDQHEVFDLIGKDAVMFRYEGTDTNGQGGPFVAQCRLWFDAVWSQLYGRQPALTSPETAADLVAGADAVLLDFDGPICAVFAAYRAHEVSEQIMRRVAAAGITLRPTDPNDPISVLRATAGKGAQIIAAVQDALVAEEAKALGRTEPHPGIPELVVELRKVGHRLAIVTNNGAGPVSDFIERHGLADDIEAVIGRDPVHPELLKPSPHSLEMALAQLDLRSSAAIFIGDSNSDVQAGHAADLLVIGYANKRGKHQRLRDAGADAITISMRDLVGTPRPAP